MSDTKKMDFEDLEHDPSAKDKIYPELARANLLRMRGEFKGAIDQCLSILKRLPEDVDAHMLIGDIYSESGDLDQARQWYDLALELSPNDAALHQKLDEVTERALNREYDKTAEQLGLPVESPHKAIYGIGIVLAILLIGVIAYLTGQRHPIKTHRTLNSSVFAPGSSEKLNPDSATTDSGQDEETATNSPIQMPEDDRALTATLTQRSAVGSHAVQVMEDQRTKILTVTYFAKPDEDFRKIGAELARSAIDQFPDVPSVTIRCIKDDRISYMADIPRTKVSDVEAPSWQADNASVPDSWISYVLTDEWQPGAGEASSAGSSNQPTVSTGGAPNPAGTTVPGNGHDSTAGAPGPASGGTTGP
jgi:hypothetical protein